MTKSINIEIWEREFSLDVEFDCYSDESVTQNQIDAFERFCNHPKWIDKAKKNVESFCKKAVENDDQNQKKDNIFSYVKPVGIFVKRDSDKPRVAIMCKYKYDPEHGLAVVFDHNGNATVGLQDIIL